MAKQTDFVRTALRVPPDLHQALHQATKKTERSFNAEIIHRLKTTFDGGGKPAQLGKQEETHAT